MNSVICNFQKILIIFFLCLLWKTGVPAQSASTLVFQGNKNYTTGELEKLISEQWQNYLENKSLSYVDDAAYVLQNHYRIQGYYFSSVDYDLADNQVIFYIQEFNPVVIQEVRIVHARAGKNLSFTEERLKKFLTPPPLIDKYYLNKMKIAEDQAAIGSFYLSQGFLNFRSEIRCNFSPPAPQSSQVLVEIAIEEGPRFYVDRLEFQGNQAFDTDELESALNFQKSQVFLARIHHDFTSSLRDFYREKGYARIQIKPEVRDMRSEESKKEQEQGNKEKERERGKKVDDAKTAESQEEDILPGFERQGRCIVFHIQENKKQTIRKILCKDNEMTEDSVIFRQLDFHEGEVYNLAKINTSKDNLNDTRLFISSDIEEKFVGDDQVDLVVSVKERNTKSVTFNVGYDTTYGVTGGFAFEHINIFGTYRQFLFSVDSSVFGGDLFKSQATAQVTEPQILGSRTWSGSIKGFGLYEETPSYDLLDRGAGISAEHKFSKILSLQLGYNITWSQILKVHGDVEEEKGTTFLSTLQQKLILNLRDSNSYPTSGSYHFIELEESLTVFGSEVDYYKVYGHTAWYIRLIDRCVLSFAFRGGVIVPFGDTDKIPIQRRYFCGGVDTIRSFKSKQLPPLDDDDKPIGGEGLFLFSTELRIPIYGNLGVSLFADSGQIITEVRTWEQYRISQLHHALGFSVWYNTPIGPIRFDMGFNPDRQENPLTGTKEDLFAWFISIGFSF